MTEIVQIQNVPNTADTTDRFVLMICNDAGGWVVRIRPNGQVEYGPGFTADEASRLFWERVGNLSQPLGNRHG